MVSTHEAKLLPRRIEFESSSPLENKDKRMGALALLVWKRKSSIARGFNNLGNTCFLNAVLQCLLHTPAVQNYPHSCTKPYCALCLLKQLFHSNSPVPIQFVRILPKLSRHFSIGRQEDAHELLRFLLDKASPLEFTAEVFAGTLRSRVQCLTCHYESVIYEQFFDLSLELIGSDLRRSLDGFFRKEVLTGANAYFCSQCTTKKPASKQFSVKTAPLVLTCHIKRFNCLGAKDTRPVRFPEAIDLSKYLLVKEEILYDLYGVIVHVGPTCRSGHYYAFVKSPNGLWFELDDSSVSRASVQRVLATDSAYILYYHRTVKNMTFAQIPIGISPVVECRTPELPVKRAPSNNLYNVIYKKRANGLSNPWVQHTNKALGYVRAPEDRQLDKGKQKKRKKQKKTMPHSIWDSTEVSIS